MQVILEGFAIITLFTPSGDTQLISTLEKDISNSHVGTDAKEMLGDVDLNRSRDIPMALGGTKAAPSSLLELPSLTTESRLPAIPSASEASEGSPFQICVGTVHAESIRVAAMQPITWHPKLKLDDHSSRSLPLKSTVCRPDLPSSEPEWMRDYGLKSPFGISYTPGSPYNGTTTRTLGSESRFSQMKTAVPPRSSLGPRLPSPIQHNTNILSSAVEFRNAIPVLVDETSGKTAVEASTAILSSSESVKTAVPPLRDEFKVSMSPMPTFPLEIERLRGMPCSSPCTPSPYLVRSRRRK